MDALITEAAEQVEAILEKEGVSRAELARRMGVTRAFVTQLLSGRRNMTLRTYADIMFALGRRVQIDMKPIARIGSNIIRWRGLTYKRIT